MFRVRIVVLVGFILCALRAVAEAGAGDFPVTSPNPSPFERGGREFQFGAGLFVTQNFHDVLRPQINDVEMRARLGWMLNSPTWPGLLRGNFEVLGEVFGGGIIKGPGHVLAGGTVLLRYNYVQPGARLVPYVHFGGGGAYSDASDDRLQRELGSAFSFNLQAGFGARFFCTPKCALFLEFDYRHISNSGLAERNVGLNSAGSLLGVGYFF